MDLGELQSFLLRHLTQEVIPFWIRHSVDWENGGMWTCLADDGSILSREKYIWSNARALWTFSALVNRIADQHPEYVGADVRETWRQAALGQYHFLKRCGRDENGYWVFVVLEMPRLGLCSLSRHTARRMDPEAGSPGQQDKRRDRAAS